MWSQSNQGEVSTVRVGVSVSERLGFAGIHQRQVTTLASEDARSEVVGWCRIGRFIRDGVEGL